MENLKQNLYLIKPSFDGTREDTKLAIEYSEEQIQEFVKNGYFVINEDDFQRLIGNADKEYLIDMEGNIYEKPPYIPTLQEIKDKKLEEIKQKYLESLYQVVWVEQEQGEEYGYDTDKESQVDFSMSQKRAELSGTTRYNVYTDKDNLSIKEFVLHTPAMFDRVLSIAGIYQEEVYAKYYKLKAQINAADNQETVEKICW